jgi:hypothetical protein
MPAPGPSPADSSADLAAADSAAENLLRSGRDVTLSGIDPSRESALDDAFAAVVPETDSTSNLGRENAGVKQRLEGEPEPEATPEPTAEPEVKPAPEKKAPEAAKPDPKPADKPARKGLLDDLIDEPAAEKKDEPEKAYEDIKLRSDASPKTQETFNAVKTRALERENAIRAQFEQEKQARLALEAKVTEFEKSKGALPKEIEQEVKELREFRALHDVTSRPEFKEKFDSRIEQNFESIYSLFKQEGWDDAKIQALKNWPEAQRVEFIENKIIPLLTPGQKRVVEAKIFDNVNIGEEKAKAVAAARTDAEKILAEQKEQPLKQRQQKDTEFANVLRPRLQKLPFVYQKEVPSTATPAEKAEIEAHNAFATELQEDIRRAIADESPEIRAEVILAVPLARHYARQTKLLLARAEAAESKLAAIKNAGNTGRLGKSAAPDSTPAPAPRPNADRGESIDDLFAQANASRRP